VDYRRNCYTYGGFGHMAHHCKNWGGERVVERRRLEYERRRIKGNIEYLNHLKGVVENLESLD